MKSGMQNVAMKTGTQNVAIKTWTQNVAMLLLTRLMIALSGPPGMSRQGTKSSHLGMSRPGAADSGEARS